MQLSLQYKCCLILAVVGLAITIPLINTVWSLFGIMLICGAFLLLFMYFEQRWIKSEYLKWGLMATMLYALIYGVLEYTLFHSPWNNWFRLSEWFPNMGYYWAFMAVTNFAITFLASRKSLALAFASIPLFSVNEDLWFWISQSIHEARYVFPVGNWFEDSFPFLQGLGEPIGIFPFLPRFYFVGWILLSILFVIQFKNLQGRKFLIFLGVYVLASALCLLFAIL